MTGFHVSRMTAGTGCPETDGGPHFFVYADVSLDFRQCLDCGAREDAR